MANWWDQAPVATPTGDQWWHAAPEVGPAAPPLDKYQQAAADQAAKLKAAGVDTSGGYAQRIVNGMSMGAAPDILAAMQTPIEMAKQGTLNPAEGYRYAKARENLIQKETEDKTGRLGTALELGAGLGSGVSLANAGATLLRPGMGLLARSGAMAGEGAAYGGTTGFFGGGDNLSDKAVGAGKGALIGAALGGVLPAAGAIASTVASPITSGISAVVNPEGFARNKMAQALLRSGKSLPEVEQEMANAAGAGQGEYTLADALGNAGQRALSGVTRSPGQASTDAVNFLDQRQAGQARRLSSALIDGLGAPKTAAQTEAERTALRTSEGNINYDAARQVAGAVDVSPAVNIIDRTLQPGVTSVMRPQSNITDNSIESTLRRAKGYLTDGKSVLTNFDGVLSAKQEIQNLIETGSNTVKKQLIPVKNALDDALAMASPSYSNARDAYRQASKGIEAVDTGRAAAKGGRIEDTIPAFNGLSPQEQSGFRSGYVDPLIENIQGAPLGVNKARQFTSQASQAELPAFAAPGKADGMMGNIGRENTMFETRARATGGSKTADNLGDIADQKIDPGMIAALLGGHPIAALQHGGRALLNGATGNFENVRNHMAQMLLTRAADAGNVAPIIQNVIDRQAHTRAIARALTSGGMSSTGEYSQKNR